MTQQNLPGVIQHVGHWETYRPLQYCEQVFSNAWRKQMDRDDFALARIVSPPDRLSAPSQRDAQVAADVVRWLGSNVGRGFINTCEQEIRKCQNLAHDWNVNQVCTLDNYDHLNHLATLVASDILQAALRPIDNTDLRAHASRSRFVIERIVEAMSLAIEDSRQCDT